MLRHAPPPVRAGGARRQARRAPARVVRPWALLAYRAQGGFAALRLYSSRSAAEAAAAAQQGQPGLLAAFAAPVQGSCLPGRETEVRLLRRRDEKDSWEYLLLLPLAGGAWPPPAGGGWQPVPLAAPRLTP